MSSDDLIHELPKSLLKWYDFSFKAKALILTDGTRECEVLGETLVEKGLYVDTFSWKEIEENQCIEINFSYDYVVMFCLLEKVLDPFKIIDRVRQFLKPSGKFLFCMNNRLGLRYFCGDRDPYTNRNFDSVENYRQTYVKAEDTFRGRLYDKVQMSKMLCDAGWKSFQFFSILSDLQNPFLIFAEDYIPNEDLTNRIISTYNYPDTVFLEEEPLYQQLIDNGMFHQMANAYLVECSMDEELSDVSHVTSSIERGREDALFTIIHKSGIVEKRAVYEAGKKRIGQLFANAQELKKHGISVVEGKLVDNIYQMPYVNAQTGQLYLKRLLQTNREEFLRQMDHFRDLIMQSSNIVKPDCGDGEGAILENGYFDMVPQNSFYIGGEFVFYDQEFCEKKYPANVLLMRMVCNFYARNSEAQKKIPIEELYDRYGLAPKREKWQKIESVFLNKLRNEEQLWLYHQKYRINGEILNANRQRMNYSEAEYQKLFVDVFKNIATRKIILFGSGTFTKRFLGFYGKEYPVYAIIDNNESKWGGKIEDVEIHSPEILRELAADDYKVIVCIKNYLSVTKQLDDMGVKNYSIFDPGKSYDSKTSTIAIKASEENSEPKKYHVGYVAGVFDMFHVGHVNLLRRAKELCDYLIVGVVSDECVYKQKEKYPIISCEDRVEVIRACRYADQVEALPEEYDGIRDAYKRFHFDCQFSGDDHGDDIGWKADKQYLEKMGADLVFFPYTEKISSTEIRKKLK